MIAETIRISMNLIEFGLIVGFTFVVGFFVGLWVRS